MSDTRDVFAAGSAALHDGLTDAASAVLSDGDEAAQARPRLAWLAAPARAVIGTAPLLMTIGCLVAAPAGTGREALAAVVLCLAYVLAFRTDFESSRGSSVPTEPVLVAMLLSLPATWVPGLVLLAIFLASVDSPERESWQHVLRLVMSGFNVIAPVATVLLLGSFAPHTPRAVVVAAAVAAQLVFDAGIVLVVGATGGGLRAMLAPLQWSLLVDATLAAVGYAVAVVAGPELPGLLLVFAPIVLIRLLAYDREEYFEQAQTLRTAYTEVTQEARRDSMTGLLNRRGWDEVLEQTTTHLRGSEGAKVATVLVADLDRLKITNDTYGHLAGDALICAFADLLTDSLPADAVVARLGGDEFAALLTCPAALGAPDLLTAVRESLLTAAPIGPVRISVSLGQATLPPSSSLAATVQAADHAARVDKELRRMSRDADATLRSA